MAIGETHLPNAKPDPEPTSPLLELPLLNLRSRFTRALPSRLFASLTTKCKAPGVPRNAAITLSGAAVLLVAGVSHAYRPVRSRHLAPHRAASGNSLSAGVVSGSLLPQPGTNLASAMLPDSSLDSLAVEAAQPQSAPRYELHLHHLHTGESLDVVYRVGNEYIPSAIASLNHFLRDHRTQDVSHYDPREFDLLHTIAANLGKSNGMIDIVCGYRTPWSNNFLRTRSAVTGVARNSQHMQAKAIDIRIPGITTSHLRDVALSLHGGGVGYYPVSEFVHVDVGPVRQWSFGGRGE